MVLYKSTPFKKPIKIEMRQIPFLDRFNIFFISKSENDFIKAYLSD